MTALDDVLPALRCPACGAGLHRDGQVRCARGHAYDVARHGYLNLVGPRSPHRGDDAAMALARERFLGAGHYAPLTDALAAAARPGLVVDLAGGTGHHLAGVLAARPESAGVCLEVSTAALRRSARAHPRLAAVGADVWSGLPLRDATAATVLSVFGPRNPAETTRVLARGGRLVVAGPLPGHLAEAREALPMLGIAADRQERIAAAYADLRLLDRQQLVWSMRLDRAAVRDLVAMGPAARHLTADELAGRVAALDETTAVTAAVEVAVLGT